MAFHGTEQRTNVDGPGVDGFRSRLLGQSQPCAPDSARVTVTCISMPLHRGIGTGTTHAEAPIGTVGARRMHGPTHSSSHTLGHVHK